MANQTGVVAVDGGLECSVFRTSPQVGRQPSRKLAYIGTKLLQQFFVLSGLGEHVAQLAESVLLGAYRQITLGLR
jgi:hypothetical protein